MFSSQKYRRGNHVFLRSTENSGGRDNPFSTIGINAFRTTNFRSSSAMRGAEFHGNTGRESTTRILSIDRESLDRGSVPGIPILEDRGGQVNTKTWLYSSGIPPCSLRCDEWSRGTSGPGSIHSTPLSQCCRPITIILEGSVRDITYFR